MKDFFQLRESLQEQKSAKSRYWIYDPKSATTITTVPNLESGKKQLNMFKTSKLPRPNASNFVIIDFGKPTLLIVGMKFNAKVDPFKIVAESVTEARKDSAADLYFDTYSAAVQHAKAQAEKKGFEVVEDDWFNQVTTGKGKPGRGKTTRHTLKLTKNDKPVRQSLSIQVYNRDTNRNTYELNFYVS